jgi:hypothetical protein
MSAKLVPTFADRGCHVVSVTDPYGRILGFILFLPSSSSIVRTRLSGPRSRPKLLRKSGSAGNRISGSVARNSDHYSTEAVTNRVGGFHNFIS